MIPNSPSRRAHILQAHALRARGFTIEQISEQTNHAPSTVHAWLKDFEAQRYSFIPIFAQDQLLVLLHSHAQLLRLHELNPPADAEAAASRNQQIQSYALIARELRMVCAQLSRTQRDVYDSAAAEQLSPDEVDAIPHAAELQQQLSDFPSRPRSQPLRSNPNRPGQNWRFPNVLKPNLLSRTVNPHIQPQKKVHPNSSRRQRPIRSLTQTSPSCEPPVTTPQPANSSNRAAITTAANTRRSRSRTEARPAEPDQASSPEPAPTGSRLRVAAAERPIPRCRESVDRRFPSSA